MLTGYIGTYTSGDSKGIYRFELDETVGHLENKVLFKEVNSPKYLAFVDDKLYSLYDEGEKSGVMILSRNGSVLASLLFENITSCHIAVKGNAIYTANYHSGTVSKLHFDGNELKLVKQIQTERKSGAHQVIFFKDLILVPCLFFDEVWVLDENLNYIDKITLPKNSGPRHGVISTDDARLYLVSELSNELFTYDIHETKFELVSQMSILPDNKTQCEGTAALRISRNGRKLYVSTRGLDILTVIDIGGEMPKIMQFESSGGNHPRDILDVANDDYLLVANRFSNELLCYRLNEGRIGIVTSKIEMPEGVSIVMEGDLND